MHIIIIIITKMGSEKNVFEIWAKLDVQKLYIAGTSLLLCLNFFHLQCKQLRAR